MSPDIENAFDIARENAICLSKLLVNLHGVHKQNAGRLLEPFQNIKIVLTSTEWANWDWLRDDPAAQARSRREGSAAPAAGRRES